MKNAHKNQKIVFLNLMFSKCGTEESIILLNPALVDAEPNFPIW